MALSALSASPLATPEEISGVEAWLPRPFPEDLRDLWLTPSEGPPGLLTPFEILDLADAPGALTGGIPFFRTPLGGLVRAARREGALRVVHPVAGDLALSPAAFVARAASEPAWLAGLDMPRPPATRLGSIAASALHRFGIGGRA